MTRLHALAETHGRRILALLAGLRRSHRRYVTQRVTGRESIAPGANRLPMVFVQGDRWAT